MTDLITQIRDDREAGTPGPWHWNDEFLCPGVLIASETDGTLQGDCIDQANARRIARVPEMEQTILDQAAKIDSLEGTVSEFADENEDLRRNNHLKAHAIDRMTNTMAAMDQKIHELKAERDVVAVMNLQSQNKALMAENETLREVLKQYHTEASAVSMGVNCPDEIAIILRQLNAAYENCLCLQEALSEILELVVRERGNA